MDQTNGNGSGSGRRRVVITGLGLVSPLGNDVATSWAALLAGHSGAGEITSFDTTNYNVHFACELKDFDPTVWIDRKAARRMDRFAQVILAAARQAESDSGVDVATTCSCRAGPTASARSRSRRSFPTWAPPGCRSSSAPADR